MGLDIDFDLLLEKMDFVAVWGGGGGGVLVPLGQTLILFAQKLWFSENRTTVKKLL